jgi:hypothetical protein
MHNIRACLIKGHAVILHGINSHIIVLQQCKCTFELYYIYMISTNVSNWITVAIFELIIYVALFLV